MPDGRDKQRQYKMIHAVLIHLAHTLRANLPYSILVFALASGLIGTLTLFLSVKREIRADAARSNARLDQLEQKLEQARSELPGADTGLAASTVNVTPVNVAPVLSGMNLGKRVQAMRMLRRNHD